MAEFFKAADFREEGLLNGEQQRAAAKAANKLLTMNGRSVFGHPDSQGQVFEWSLDSFAGHTHKALLINIEPIEEKKVSVTKKDLLRASQRFNERSFNPPLSFYEYLVKELGL